MKEGRRWRIDHRAPLSTLSTSTTLSFSLFLAPRAPLFQKTPKQDRIAQLRPGGNAGAARERGSTATAGNNAAPSTTTTAFAAAVAAASASIDALALHVRAHRADYSSGGRACSEHERDRIEVEAGRLTRDATAGVEGVRVMAANAAAASSSSSSSHDTSEFDGFDPGTAAAAAAYRAGVALALSERLRAASGVFDRARAARYASAASEREEREAALRRAAAKAAAASSSSPLKGGGAPFDFSSPSSPSPSQQQAQMQLQMQAPRTTTTTNSATAALLAEISTQQADVSRAEATARELASLNRAFAGAVATQAEAIEALYEQALVSVANVKRGNAQLRKANAAGAGARRWVFIALLVAALGILLADWLSS